MKILTLGQPPTDTPIDVANGQVVIASNIFWVKWLSLIFNILINVGPQIRVEKVLDFPNTLAQTSSDLTIAAPGAKASMPVSLGAPLPPVNSQFSAYTGTDIVTIRFANFSAAPINPPSGTFTVAVHTGEST